jgi:hypothetical protein
MEVYKVNINKNVNFFTAKHAMPEQCFHSEPFKFLWYY